VVEALMKDIRSAFNTFLMDEEVAYYMEHLSDSTFGRDLSDALWKYFKKGRNGFFQKEFGRLSLKTLITSGASDGGFLATDVLCFLAQRESDRRARGLPDEYKFENFERFFPAYQTAAPTTSARNKMVDFCVFFVEKALMPRAVLRTLQCSLFESTVATVDAAVAKKCSEVRDLENRTVSWVAETVDPEFVDRFVTPLRRAEKSLPHVFWNPPEVSSRPIEPSWFNFNLANLCVAGKGWNEGEEGTRKHLPVFSNRRVCWERVQVFANDFNVFSTGRAASLLLAEEAKALGAHVSWFKREIADARVKSGNAKEKEDLQKKLALVRTEQTLYNIWRTVKRYRAFVADNPGAVKTRGGFGDFQLDSLVRERVDVCQKALLDCEERYRKKKGLPTFEDIFRRKADVEKKEKEEKKKKKKEKENAKAEKLEFYRRKAEIAEEKPAKKMMAVVRKAPSRFSCDDEEEEEEDDDDYDPVRSDREKAVSVYPSDATVDWAKISEEEPDFESSYESPDERFSDEEKPPSATARSRKPPLSRLTKSGRVSVPLVDLSSLAVGDDPPKRRTFSVSEPKKRERSASDRAGAPSKRARTRYG
jgi:hypothetical protein